MTTDLWGGLPDGTARPSTGQTHPGQADRKPSVTTARQRFAAVAADDGGQDDHGPLPCMVRDDHGEWGACASVSVELGEFHIEPCEVCHVARFEHWAQRGEVGGERGAPLSVGEVDDHHRAVDVVAGET